MVLPAILAGTSPENQTVVLPRVHLRISPDILARVLSRNLPGIHTEFLQRFLQELNINTYTGSTRYFCRYSFGDSSRILKRTVLRIPPGVSDGPGF